MALAVGHELTAPSPAPAAAPSGAPTPFRTGWVALSKRMNFWAWAVKGAPTPFRTGWVALRGTWPEMAPEAWPLPTLTSQSWRL